MLLTTSTLFPTHSNPHCSTSLSSSHLSTASKSTQFSRAMDKMARRSFHFTSRNLNRISQHSLNKGQIKDITHRAFSAISRTRPQPSTSILNIIKGKPHRIRLGQTASATTGFGEISHDFYTNQYSDKIPGAIKLTFESVRSDDRERGQSRKGRLISSIKKKARLFGISQKVKKHENQSRYIKKLDSIIFGCNNLLNPEDMEGRGVRIGRYV